MAEKIKLELKVEPRLKRLLEDVREVTDPRAPLGDIAAMCLADGAYAKAFERRHPTAQLRYRGLVRD